MNKLTPEQLVNNLYTASRIANLTAEQHEIMKANAEELLVILAKIPAPADVTD